MWSILGSERKQEAGDGVRRGAPRSRWGPLEWIANVPIPFPIP